MAAVYPGPLSTHGRFDYRAFYQRPACRCPNGAGLAVYLGFNIEHFAFGEGLGATIGPISAQPDVLNFSWREYGNRVGAWRCLLEQGATACRRTAGSRPPGGCLHGSPRAC